MTNTIHKASRIAVMVLGMIVSLTARVNAAELHDAAKGGDLARVESILKIQPDVDVRNETMLTPLMSASAKGHIEVVRLLLAKGADAKAASKAGTTALMYSAFCKDPNAATEIATQLLKKGADVNGADQENQTALMIFATSGNTNGISLLLSHGAKIDTQDSTGHTALMAAAVNGKIDAVKLLLSKGANAAIRAADGKTARDYALIKQENETSEQTKDRSKIATLLK